MMTLTIVQRERAPRDPLILRSRIASSVHASRSFSVRDDDLYQRKLSRILIRADIALIQVTLVKRRWHCENFLHRDGEDRETRTRSASVFGVFQEKFARFRKCAGDFKDEGDPIDLVSCTMKDF